MKNSDACWRGGFFGVSVISAAPVSASSVRQTGASGATVDLSWKRQEKAAYYKIYYKLASERAYHYLKDVKASGENCAASLKLPKAGRIYRIQLVPYDQSKRKGTAVSLTDCRTLPGKISAQPESYATSKSMKLYWNGEESAKGYEFYVTDLAGGLVKRCKTEGKASMTMTGLDAGEFYRVRIRGYFFHRKEKYLRACVLYVYCPAAPGKIQMGQPLRGRGVLAGCAGGDQLYGLYVGEPFPGIQKVTTVPQAEAYIPGLRRDRKYYVYVKANLRKGQKTYASPKTHYYSFRMQGDES